MGSNDSFFPGHTFYTLNDGTTLPSPAFGVGSVLKGTDVTEVVLLAFKSGYRHIDNSAIYKNEEYVGEAIKQSNIPREELYITTKFDALQGDDIEANLAESLRKLQLDYVDLYLLHFPGMVKDPHSAWKQLETLVSKGLARSIGLSNYNPDQINHILEVATIKPAVNQIRYHAYNAGKQQEILDVCEKQGILVQAFSALTPLTTKPGGKAEAKAAELASLLSKRGSKGVAEVTPGQAILASLKTQGIAAVTTSSKASRQLEQLAVFDAKYPTLSDEEVKGYLGVDPGWGEHPDSKTGINWL